MELYRDTLDTINSAMEKMIIDKQINLEVLKSLKEYFSSRARNTKDELLKVLGEDDLDSVLEIQLSRKLISDYNKNLWGVDIQLRINFINYLIYKAYSCWVECLINERFNQDKFREILEYLKKINKDLKNNINNKDITGFNSWLKFVRKEFYDKIKDTCLEK